MAALRRTTELLKIFKKHVYKDMTREELNKLLTRKKFYVMYKTVRDIEDFVQLEITERNELEASLN